MAASALLGLVAVTGSQVVAGTALADPATPPSTVINTTLPTWGNPQAHYLNIYGAIGGLRASDSLAGYAIFVTCDDLNSYSVSLQRVSSPPLPDGSTAISTLLSIPPVEEGHTCRIQTTAPLGREVRLSTTGWSPAAYGYWSLALSGSVLAVPVVVPPRGGAY
ncbi:hypothetical protein [Subtercola sp. YIM 133946]|uniref:hypothetical protein n=1 Tax=Subtercola sp. YIM 133946 TaxID=3118909 RepID=UPI002F95B353